MYPDSEAISHPTAGQLVADNIRRKIILGEFRDGDFLPNEAQLLAQYGVSRPVLREAIRILQSESLLTIRRGSKGGARVNAPRPEPVARQAGGLLQYGHTTVFDVFRARAIIEPPAVRLLAETAGPTTVQRLRDALETEANAINEPRRWGKVHADFHTLVVELSGSNTLALFAHIMSDITTAHTQAVWQHAADEAQKRANAELAHRVHRKLVRLVEDRKAADAEQLWRRHLEETTEQMLENQGQRELLDLIG
ncbi:FCD domain-containing protein [Mycobacterium sp. CVI_P3]|uniref:FCD domain-containing protein n=1 Tax=Mycobacterium pinniadriaticum TaxID=2994102 RepID=A0ABT3SBY9_9MYCO|nr:FCD domain-containing protein [Mycobacterium pinniadriaticum]MCX2930611.1 FCD domain-containing protein [Mycobacterium pinniadriaticum]MCX2937035.1 FCD domain-containing protein [Mycobacterium pinniadriaticum]